MVRNELENFSVPPVPSPAESRDKETIPPVRAPAARKILKLNADPTGKYHHGSDRNLRIQDCLPSPRRRAVIHLISQRAGDHADVLAALASR